MKNIAPKVDNTSTLPAAAFNSIADELENLVTDSGQTLDGTPEDSADPAPNQISKSVSMAARAADFFTDSGSTNTYVLTKVGTWESETAYKDGARFRFKALTTNTGASTVNIQTIGSRDIRFQDNSVLTTDEIRSGLSYDIVYDLGANNFKLMPTGNPSLPAFLSFNTWNPSDLVGTYTDATSIGTSVGTTAVTFSSISGGLVTVTFVKAGTYRIDMPLTHTHGANYTETTMRFDYGGTATNYSLGTFYFGSALPTLSTADMAGTNFFVVVATAGQTLTIRARGRTTGSGAVGNHNYFARVFFTNI